MSTRMTRVDEARALERVAIAAHEVQVASVALKEHFSPDGDAQPPMPKLIRFEAAMLELSTARADFDAAFTFGSSVQSGRSDVGSMKERAFDMHNEENRNQSHSRKQLIGKVEEKRGI